MKEAELVDRFELLWEIEHSHKLYFLVLCVIFCSQALGAAIKSLETVRNVKKNAGC